MAAKLFSGISELNTGQLQVTDKILGRGSYATVHEVYHGGMKCAAKKLHNFFFLYSDERSQQNDAKDAIVRFSEECRILGQLSSHPNIVQFKGVYWESGAPAPLLVMEYLPTNIDLLIEKCGKIPYEISFLLLQDIACGLKFLHNRTPPVIHRDLTARNVLVSTDLHAKIADFGMATGHIRPNNMTQAPGNFIYMPPESMSANPSYDTSIDIFSFGVLAIYMLSGTLPIPSVSAVQTDISGLRAVHEFSRRWDYLEMIGFDHPSMNLIFPCIDNDPSRRTTADVIVDRIHKIVAEHPTPPNYKERWKMIIERLERNEDVTELIALEQVNQGQVQVTTEERESENSSLGITCVGSGKQEGVNYPEYNQEQKMNIKGISSDNNNMENLIANEMYSLIEKCVHEEAVQMSDIIAVVTKGCSLSYSTLSGVSNIERKLQQILFNEVVSRSLKQVIVNCFTHYCLRHILMADKTNTMNLVNPSSPTTNYILNNMESKNFSIVPYESLKSDQTQGAKMTHLPAVVDMHTPSLSITLSGLVGFQLSLILSLSGFAIPPTVSKQIMLLLRSVDQQKGGFCKATLNAVHVTPIFQALSQCVHSVTRTRIQELELANPAQFSGYTYLSALSKSINTSWIVTKTAVFALINSESSDAPHYVDIYLIKEHLGCKYGHQENPHTPSFIRQSGCGSVVAYALTTPGTHNTHMLATVSIPEIVYTTKAMTSSKLEMKSNHGSLASGVALDDLILLMDTCNSLLQNCICFQYSNQLSSQLSRLPTFTLKQNKGNVEVTSTCTTVNKGITYPTRLDIHVHVSKPKIDAKTTRYDHTIILQLTADKAIQHNSTGNICLSVPRQFGVGISPLSNSRPNKEVKSSPHSIKVTSYVADRHHQIMKSETRDQKTSAPPKNPSDNNKKHHKGHNRVLTSPTLQSLKHVACSCLTLNTCTAADNIIIKTILALLECVLLDGFALIVKPHPIKGANPVYCCKEIQLLEETNTDQLIMACQVTLSISPTEATSKDGKLDGSLATTVSQKSPTCIQPYRRNRRRSKQSKQDSHAPSGGVSFSQLIMDQIQDVTGNTTINIKNVISFKSTHIFIASDSVTFHLSLNWTLLFHLRQTILIQGILMAAHLLRQQTADTTLLPFNTRLYTCNKISLSIQSYMYVAMENKQLTESKFLSKSATVNLPIENSSLNNNSNCMEEFGKFTRKKAGLNITTKPILKPNVKLLIHSKQDTRVHAIDARLSKLSCNMDAVHPSMVAIELRSLDTTIHLLYVSIQCDRQVLRLQYFRPHAIHASVQLSQPLFIITAIELNQYQTSRNINSDSHFTDIDTYLKGMPVTSKCTNLTLSYKSKYLEGMGDTWDEYYPPHMTGTKGSEKLYMYHTHSSDHKNEVLWQGQNKLGKRQSHNFSRHVARDSPACRCDQSKSSKTLHWFVQLVSNVLECGPTTNTALATANISLQHLNLGSIFDLSAHVHNCLTKHKDLVLFARNLESNTSEIICRIGRKPKFAHSLQSLIETSQLDLRRSLIDTWISVTSIKHYLTVQERSMDTIGILQIPTKLTIIPHQLTRPLSNSSPLCMNCTDKNDHSSDSGTNRKSDKGGVRGENRSGGGEGHDGGDQGGDKGGEDSCDKSGGDGGNYGDGSGGGSDGEGKKPSRKDQRSRRPNRKKKRKKGGERKRRHSTKQSSRKKMKKKRLSHVYKQSYVRYGIDMFSIKYYRVNPASLDKIMAKILPMEGNTIIKLSQRSTRILKAQLQTWNPSELYEKGSESDHERLDDSMHVRTYMDDSNDNEKNGDERDSKTNEQKLTSKIQKHRHPHRKRRRKRRGRKGKGRRRRRSTKRTLRKKKKSQNYSRLSSRSRLPHVQREISYDQPSGAIVPITRVSRRYRCPKVQHCFVPASSIVQNHEHLSFEQCQVLAHTRAWEMHVQMLFQRRSTWLYCRLARCRPPVEISETSQTCNAIVHGRLLVHAAQEQHFSVEVNGRVTKSYVSQVLPVRPYFNLSFIDDSRLGASLSSQLHDDAVHNLNQPLATNIILYGSLEDYQSGPYFPPPIMEQNVMETNPPVIHINSELVIQGRRRRPYSTLQWNNSNTYTWSTSYEEAIGLPKNAELAIIDHRRRPQLRLLDSQSLGISAVSTSESATANASQLSPPHQISSSVQLNGPYRAFIVLVDHTTTEHIPPMKLREPIDQGYCDGAAVHNAAVCGLGSTISFNMSVEDFTPVELFN